MSWKPKLWSALCSLRLVRTDRMPLPEGTYPCIANRVRISYDDRGRTYAELLVTVIPEEVEDPDR